MQPIKLTVRTFTGSSKSDEYKAIAKKLKARGLHHFEVWHNNLAPTSKPSLAAGVYTVETDHLFSDQTNTAEGFRVFDWYDGMTNLNRIHRVMHWIEDDDGWKALQELRRNTAVCGYCGKQEPMAKGNVFCPHCIGSQYLTEKDLHLTRMMSVELFMPKRAELTDAERAHLMPLFVEAQTFGHTERDKARIAKERADILSDYDSSIRNATTRRDGFLWLMDHGIRTDNVIYYKHTGRFGFGWRTKLQGELLSRLLNVISEFSWPYDIECEDGRKLSGN